MRIKLFNFNQDVGNKAFPSNLHALGTHYCARYLSTIRLKAKCVVEAVPRPQPPLA